MTTITAPAFKSFDETESFLEAAATNLGGFTITQDFEPEIEDYLVKETKMWQLIPTKKPAPAPTVKHIRKTNRPRPGFVNRNDLSTARQNNHAATANDLSDPGQEVKAIAGTIEFDHFNRSMADQQGREFGDEVAQETDELLLNTTRFMEMALFSGNAAQNPEEFNGLENLIPAQGHIIPISITGDDPASIVSTINATVVRATSDRNILRKVTHIFTTGPGALLIQEEVGQSVFYSNVEEIVPGVKVPGIMTANGQVPIVTTPYLSDLDGGAGDDIIRFYLVDMTTIEWNGVYPYGGERSFNPQIFDVTKYLNGQFLVEKRMVLVYGTPYAKNRGQGIYRIDVRAPAGTALNTGGVETLV